MFYDYVLLLFISGDFCFIIPRKKKQFQGTYFITPHAFHYCFIVFALLLSMCCVDCNLKLPLFRIPSHILNTIPTLMNVAGQTTSHNTTDNIVTTILEPGWRDASVEKSACLQFFYLYRKNDFRQLYNYSVQLFIILYLKLAYTTACLPQQNGTYAWHMWPRRGRALILKLISPADPPLWNRLYTAILKKNMYLIYLLVVCAFFFVAAC